MQLLRVSSGKQVAASGIRLWRVVRDGSCAVGLAVSVRCVQVLAGDGVQQTGLRVSNLSVTSLLFSAVR